MTRSNLFWRCRYCSEENHIDRNHCFNCQANKPGPRTPPEPEPHILSGPRTPPGPGPRTPPGPGPRTPPGPGPRTPPGPGPCTPSEPRTTPYSSPYPYGTESHPPVLDWTCVQCGNVNSRTSMCHVCQAPRPSLDHIPDINAYWTCNYCNTNNLAAFDHCYSCKRSQADAMKQVSDDVFVQHNTDASSSEQNGDVRWVCRRCKSKNDATNESCHSCQSVQEISNAVSEAEKGSKKTKREKLWTPSEPTKPPQIKPGDWICNYCKGVNFAKREFCFTCKAFKAENSASAADVLFSRSPGETKPPKTPTKTKPPKTPTQTKPKPDNLSTGANAVDKNWACEMCHSTNTAKSVLCASCKTFREDTKRSSHQSTWRCQQCFLTNCMKNSPFHCIQCASPRDCTIKPRNDNWNCRKCNTVNSARRNKCYICFPPRARKDTSTSDKGISEASRPPPPPPPRNSEIWKCSLCKQTNPSSISQCMSCNPPNRGTPPLCNSYSSPTSNPSYPFPPNKRRLIDPPQHGTVNQTNSASTKNIDHLLIPEDWKCQTCDNDNIALRNFCKSCDSPRKSIAMQYIQYKKHGVSALVGFHLSDFDEAQSWNSVDTQELSSKQTLPVTKDHHTDYNKTYHESHHQTNNAHTFLMNHPAKKYSEGDVNPSPDDNLIHGEHSNSDRNYCARGYTTYPNSDKYSIPTGYHNPGECNPEQHPGLDKYSHPDNHERQKISMGYHDPMTAAHPNLEGNPISGEQGVTCLQCKAKNHVHKVKCVRCDAPLTDNHGNPLSARPIEVKEVRNDLETWTCLNCDNTVPVKSTHCPKCNSKRRMNSQPGRRNRRQGYHSKLPDRYLNNKRNRHENQGNRLVDRVDLEIEEGQLSDHTPTPPPSDYYHEEYHDGNRQGVDDYDNGDDIQHQNLPRMNHPPPATQQQPPPATRHQPPPATRHHPRLLPRTKYHAAPQRPLFLQAGDEPKHRPKEGPPHGAPWVPPQIRLPVRPPGRRQPMNLMAHPT